MPKKDSDVTVPMSSELEDLVEGPLEYGDSKSRRIRDLIRAGLIADGIDEARIPTEDYKREAQSSN